MAADVHRVADSHAAADISAWHMEDFRQDPTTKHILTLFLSFAGMLFGGLAATLCITVALFVPIDQVQWAHTEIGGVLGLLAFVPGTFYFFRHLFRQGRSV